MIKTAFRIVLPALATAALLVACGPGGDERDAPQAREITRENFRDVGDWVVHFNAQPTDMLPAEVAKAYGIERSGNRAMLNVAVLRKEEGTTGTPVTANVTVKASNLTGQLKNMALREITEGPAIYYIGEVPVANQETLVFEIVVRPEGAADSYTIRFRQQFYAS
jgi:hypothetical protein